MFRQSFENSSRDFVNRFFCAFVVSLNPKFEKDLSVEEITLRHTALSLASLYRVTTHELRLIGIREEEEDDDEYDDVYQFHPTPPPPY